jgi:hypothetical protein
MLRLLGLAITIPFILALGALLLSPYAKRIDYRPSSLETGQVPTSLPINILSLNGLLRGTFEVKWPPTVISARANLPPPFNKFVAGTVPDAFQLRSFSRLDPGLAKYAELPATARQYDVCLYDPLGGFWRSDYYYRGEPAEFNTKFIVHLTSKSQFLTTVEVMEFQPQVRAGKRFGFSAHTGPLPGYFDDIRWVHPTAREQSQLLAIISEEAQKRAR